ncbi:hypothetical protein GCM10009087_26440 [Sphingomonas oligophenolica]|uniref:Uncharacterized protein n=1 Tax=Sphingomonas oligophenolica TaxID=301154 RepID=A0ABU9YD51_9SPHN
MTMLTRIARGIHASLSGAASIEGDSEWEAMSESQRTPHLMAALRMLTIIRTPTDAMLKEGDRAGAPSDAANIWERMAYTALHEER